MKLIAFALALATLATPVMAADQFNLNCEGQRRFKDRTEPVSITIRVDLSRRLWCRDECLGMWEIATVSPIALIFQNDVDLMVLDGQPYDAIPTKHYLMVSRDDGTFAEGVRARYEEVFSGGGKCVVAPFTGLPPDPNKLF